MLFIHLYVRHQVVFFVGVNEERGHGEPEEDEGAGDGDGADGDPLGNDGAAEDGEPGTNEMAQHSANTHTSNVVNAWAAQSGLSRTNDHCYLRERWLPAGTDPPTRRGTSWQTCC